MQWRYKAAVQNLVGVLPPAIGNPVYYFILSRYGGLRDSSPMSRLQAGAEIARRIYDSGRTLESKTVLEVGTGYQLNLPLSLWLCGASQITTVDLNRYLKPKLVMADVEYVRDHQQDLCDLYSGLPATRCVKDRLEQLISCVSFEDLLATTGVRYLAPADAMHLDLDAETIDYHISFTVLEHIPPSVLRGIFDEGRRLRGPAACLCTTLTLPDDFAHSDDSISSINFLQFSESEWEGLAGNRFMFHNRLRMDDFRALLLDSGLEILSLDGQVDESAIKVMKQGFALSERFRAKDLATNATMDGWLIASTRK